MTYSADRDPFARHAVQAAAPGRRLVTITPHDTNQLQPYVRALRVTVPSTVALTNGLATFSIVDIDAPNDATLTPISVAPGVCDIPIGARLVRATGFRPESSCKAMSETNPFEVHMLATGLDLPTLAMRGRSAPWYRPDDVLRILPASNRAMVRLSDGSVVAGSIEALIAASRFAYFRTGLAWEIDTSGARREFGSNVPRITDRGMTIEPAATNLFLNSFAPATQTIPVTNGTVYTVSVHGSGSITLSGAGSGTATPGNPVTFTASGTSLTATVSGAPAMMQCEAGAVATTPIQTFGSPATRAADDFRCAVAGMAIPTTGTLIAELRSPYDQNPVGSANPGYTRILGIDTSGNSRLNLTFHGVPGGTGPLMGNANGTFTEGVGPIVGVGANAVGRIAAGYAVGTKPDVSVNGGAVAAGNHNTAFEPPATFIGLGSAQDGGGAVMTGVVGEWCIRSTRLSQADLIAESVPKVMP